MTYINLIHWLAGFLVVAYTAFGLFVLHDEKTVKLSWYAYGTERPLISMWVNIFFVPKIGRLLNDGNTGTIRH